MQDHKIQITYGKKRHLIQAAPVSICGQVDPTLLSISLDGLKTQILVSFESFDGSFFCRSFGLRFASFKSLALKILKHTHPRQESNKREVAPMTHQEDAWDAESIMVLLNENERAVRRAIVAIFNSQDEAQKAGQSSGKNSGRGFSRFDRPSGNHLARMIIAGQRLNQKQIEKARKLAIKYRRQLVALANDGEG